jgi:carbon storage regulator
MLVLSRKEKESIQIDGNVTVTILGIKGSKVLIGIEAPGNVSVHRLEVADKIKKTKEGK